MRCPNRGQENPSEAKFCGKCATRLSSEPPAASFSAAPSSASEEVTSGMKIGVIAGSLLTPLLGIILGVIYMNDANPSKKAAGKTWLFVGIGVTAAYCICALASGVLQNMSQGM